MFLVVMIAVPPGLYFVAVAVCDVDVVRYALLSFKCLRVSFVSWWYIIGSLVFMFVSVTPKISILFSVMYVVISWSLSLCSVFRPFTLR